MSKFSSKIIYFALTELNNQNHILSNRPNFLNIILNLIKLNFYLYN